LLLLHPTLLLLRHRALYGWPAICLRRYLLLLAARALLLRLGLLGKGIPDTA
jgi:hypothetical protein